MKKIVFTEAHCQPENLYPFTLTRRIQDLRLGILTIREKWEMALGMPSFDKRADDYKDGTRTAGVGTITNNDTVYLIQANLLPTAPLIAAVLALPPGTQLTLPDGRPLAACISGAQFDAANGLDVPVVGAFLETVKQIFYPWDLVTLNGWAIQQDIALLQQFKTFITPAATNTVRAAESVFIEAGAEVDYCHLNATDGPIYIAAGAVVMEGSLLRGPLSIGANAVVKMGAKIYGATTIGPYCTVGGEIKNTIFFNHSNKAHDGYLGDAVIGGWCNLGAGTTASNVSNTAGNVVVKLRGKSVSVGLKCGVLMGDYSRTAINISINTGTVIGVACNVFGGGLTPKHMNSFSWGSDGAQRYRFDKAMEHIANWKRLKKEQLTKSETDILTHIFEHY